MYLYFYYYVYTFFEKKKHTILRSVKSFLDNKLNLVDMQKTRKDNF